MRPVFFCVGVAVLGFGVRAQGIVEYGVAAGVGSSAGTLAGKGINVGIDSALKRAAGTPSSEPRSEPPPSTHSTLPAVSLYPTLKATEEPEYQPHEYSNTTGQSSRPAAPDRRRAVPSSRYPAVPRGPAITAQDVANVTPGMSREEISVKLGLPASLLTIPEEGQLVEVYHYAGPMGELGSVRLVNGIVEKVNTVGGYKAAAVQPK